VLPALPREQTSHADVMVQFLAQDVAAVAVMDPAHAPEAAERLDLAVGALRRVARALGERLRVIRIPMHAEGDVFYSYLNSTRVHDLLFVPDYRAVRPALQAEAHAKLQAALPDVTLIKVPADYMVPLGGAIHCITLGLNVPAAPPALSCVPKLAKAPKRTRPTRQ
jgi:agmatine/peptidylarginine deiminase